MSNGPPRNIKDVGIQPLAVFVKVGRLRRPGRGEYFGHLSEIHNMKAAQLFFVYGSISIQFFSAESFDQEAARVT